MAVNNMEFGAQVSAWVRQTQQRMDAVFRESSKLTVRIAQGVIPVDTGFARASVRASLSAMPQVIPGFKGEKDQTYAYDEGEVVSVINNARAGEHVIYIGWTANYVPFLEQGHSKRAPSGFVRLAALQWSATVRQVSQELRGRVGG